MKEQRSAKHVPARGPLSKGSQLQKHKANSPDLTSHQFAHQDIRAYKMICCQQAEHVVRGSPRMYDLLRSRGEKQKSRDIAQLFSCLFSPLIHTFLDEHCSAAAAVRKPLACLTNKVIRYREKKAAAPTRCGLWEKTAASPCPPHIAAS